jgi:predicted metal-dependent phosphoesterase TrpH
VAWRSSSPSGLSSRAARSSDAALPLKLDLHVHTYHSCDAHIRPAELAAAARRRGLDGVAITDHDTVSGLREFRCLEGVLVVPGVEVSSAQGHVLALNVDQSFTAHRSFADTVDQIHDAGGVAVLAHPTAFFKGMSAKAVGRIFDAVEVVNASAVPFAYSVRKNRELAVRLGLPQTGGSDAHCAAEVGCGYSVVDVAADADAAAVVRAITRGAVTPGGQAIGWGMRVRRGWLGVQRRRARLDVFHLV